MISHRNMLAESSVWIESAPKESGEQFSPSDTFLSYSPLAHQAERCMYSALTCQGVAIGMSSGDPTLLFDDARALKPAIMYLVPRIGNRLVQTLKSTFLKTPEQVAAWEQSYAAKRRVLLSGTLPRDEKLDDSMGLMKAMRDYVGGRLRMSASGAAPAPAANLEFHRIVFGIRLFERFGQTESTSAFATTNFSDLWNPYGSHVGTATRQSEFKLVARPEMGYNVTEGNNWVGSKGEAACRGTVVFRGYYLQKEKTEEALVDGWLLTGDVVELLPDGTLKVIGKHFIRKSFDLDGPGTQPHNALTPFPPDRVKNVFKLSRGEFVAPERVEVAYARSKYVLQCYVDGYREQPSLVAIIVPDPEQIGAFAMKAGIPGDYAQLVKDHRVTAEVFSDLQRIAKEDGLPFYEQAAAITLSDCVFTVENNLLTPTIKNRRPQLRERFRKEFEEMYARLGRESEERAKGGAKL